MAVEPMGDAEFLDYCTGMAETPRCGFVPMHLARLYRLSGDETNALLWEAEANYVVDADRHFIRDLVASARGRMPSM